MNYRHPLYGTLCLLVCSQTLFSQNHGLWVNSPYGGVYATQANPANTSFMAHKWVVSPGSFDSKIANDYMSLNMPYHPLRLVLGNYPDSLRTKYDNPLWRWSWIQTNARRETVSFHSLFNISGPSALFKYKNHSFGLLSGFNVFADMSGVPQSLVNHIYEELKSGKKLEDKPALPLDAMQKVHLNIKQQTWVSVGFNYAYLWTFKRRKQLSTGITYKLLHSIGGTQMQLDAGEFVEQSDKTIKISTPGIHIKTMMPRNHIFYPRGFGGIDLGLVFQDKKSETGRSNNNKKRHPDYKYKVGLSILDIGHLVYTRTITTEMQSRNQSLTLPSVEDMMQWSPDKVREELLKSISDLDNTGPETFYGKRIRIGLPTRLLLYGNIQINKYLYIDGVWQQNLRKRDGNNINSLSYLSLTPRIENKWFTIGLPFSLDNNYRQAGLGLYARLYWLYMGSRNIVSIISPNGRQSTDFFVGIQFGNLPGKPFKGKTPYMFMRKRRCAEF
ncbi:MAG: hypothetical protein JNM67_02980 [Bacteroidetes bacterium]|nr:hypothetical protein [Bacteroidota bacterium]